MGILFKGFGPDDAARKAAELRAANGTDSKKVEQKEQASIKPVPLVEKKAEASSLEALSWQNIAGMSLGVDKSEAATAKRIEHAFANEPGFKAINEFFGIDKTPAAQNDFLAYAKANIKGADPDKLNRHLERGVSQETETGTADVYKRIAAYA